MTLVISPLTEQNWKEFEKLFGPKGACAGCWCMYWRIPKKDYETGKGAGNKRRMKQLVRNGRFAGLLAYSGKEVVGWCSLGPRKEFPALDRSKILARIDDKPVWSIVCFFIDKSWRKKGLSTLFLKEVVRYAGKKRIKFLEGYPIDTDQENYPATFAWTGFFKSFRQAGFKEVARRSPTRPIMRLTLTPTPTPTP
jgi:GNAT superfamily N-acetyltransferase